MKAQETINKIVQSIQATLLGKSEAVALATCTFLSGGHLLIEDVPGVGKTTLAKAMAQTFGGDFSRIQFTSDMLPSDIIGVSIWNRDNKQFEFKQGPIFANIVLADEINRASPKTQSALLEAMSEAQISQEGISHALTAPFMVIATQNVNESYGTYPLPESQLDRFTMRIRLGYTDAAVEKQIVTGQIKPVKTSTATAVSPEELAQLKTIITATKIEESVLDYLMAIIHKTRENSQLSLGAGPRGGIALHNCAQAYAQLHGRDYVLADDIKKLALPVLAHRLIQQNDGGYIDAPPGTAESILTKIIQSIAVPV